METFNACTVLITGASSGIGREFALQLAPMASTLILVARRLDRLEALKKEILQLRPAVDVFVYGLDLANGSATSTFVEWLDQNRFKINFLINNAGVGDHGLFSEGSWERVEKMLAVNVTALTRLTHQLVPQMMRQGGGAILNVSSVASLVPIPHLNVYAATKAYVTSFSEGLRAELRGTNISVTALCPGPVPTEFGQEATRGESGSAFDATTPEFLSVDAATAARAGLKAVARDRARVVPGFSMWLIALFLAIVPIFIIRPFLSYGALKRRK